jgi:LPXTG-motif cell wall-anchored protein
VPVLRPLLPLVLLLAAALAVPSSSAAQSAGDDQYTDPFGQVEEPQGGGEQPAPPAPEPVPAEPAPPAGGNGTAEAAPQAEAAQEGSPTLPRTGAPVVLFAAAGYALLLAGIAIRRKI